MEGHNPTLSFPDDPSITVKQSDALKSPTRSLKTRPSLQALLTKSSFNTSPSSSPPHLKAPRIKRSVSSNNLVYGSDYFENPKLTDIPVPAEESSLLDDDPFANLSSSSSSSFISTSVPEVSDVFSGTPTFVSSPTSYLPEAALIVHYAPPPKRPKSYGHVRPAREKPAFTPRPSLPSLSTLAQMNVAAPRKIRAGRPGARLPHEPWNLDENDLHNLTQSRSTTPSNSNFPQHVLQQPSPPLPSLPMSVSQEQQATDASEPPTAEPGETVVESPQTSEVVVTEDISDTHPLPRDATGTCMSRSLSAESEDTDVDSLPSLSQTSTIASEPSSTALSRSPSISSTTWSDQNNMPVNGSAHPSLFENFNVDMHGNAPHTHYPADDARDDLDYHSDFDYYTQNFNDDDPSDPDAQPVPRGIRSPKAMHAGKAPYRAVHSPDHVSRDDNNAAQSSVVPHSSHAGPTQARALDAERGAVRAGQEGRGDLGERRPSLAQQGGEHREQRGHERLNGGDTRRTNVSHGGRSYPARHSSRPNADAPSPRPPRRSASTSSSSSSSADEGDNGTEYYTADGNSTAMLVSSRLQSNQHPAPAKDSDEDEVPLARQIPGALTAQKSIRKQVRDERQQRRLDRAASRGRQAAEAPGRGANSAIPPLPTQPHGRQRSHSLAATSRSLRREPTRSQPPTPQLPDGVVPADLARKLLQVQASQSNNSSSLEKDVFKTTKPLDVRSRSPNMESILSRRSTETATSGERSLRSMRSFHRPERVASATTADYAAPIAPPPPLAGGHRFAHGAGASRASEELRRAASARVSAERDRETLEPVARPPLPPLPPAIAQQAVPRSITSQQRVFIGDLQRFNMVEVAQDSTAGDVIAMVNKQGGLEKAAIGWMLWEMAQDFGMERPIRSYELLSDVTSAWNKDKMVNAFMLKPSYMAAALSSANIPTSSPKYRGWVEWESKKGKWSKRWLELREHSLWLSKRDTGKDEVFLCSLSNFDAYYVTRRHKSPKPFVFAIKSTDNLTLFEDASDYLHVFSCNQKDGEKWMEAILVARSYVLYQERNILFAKTAHTLSAPPPVPPSSSLPLTRSRTKSSATRPAQPLVKVSAPFSSATPTAVAFEPGSLLAKR